MKSTDKNFGLMWSIIFGFLGLQYILTSNSKSGYKMFVFGIALCLCSIFFPQVFKPFNFCWIKLGAFLQKISNPVILGVIFFLIFVPIGFFYRRFSKNEFKIQYELNLDSYWKIPAKNGQSTFKTQF